MDQRDDERRLWDARAGEPWVQDAEWDDVPEAEPELDAWRVAVLFVLGVGAVMLGVLALVAA